MKYYACTTAISILALNMCVYGEDVSNPQEHFLADYGAGEVVKMFKLDVNGDGVADWLFATIESNPDPTTRMSDEQAAGSMTWDVYVSNPGAATFKVNKRVEIGGEITDGAGLDVNPERMYVGNISEIGRFGIVSFSVKRSKSENSTVIYAYTWEVDHFKQRKLTEYAVDQQNTIFDKYLKDDKRTRVTLQKIKP